MGCMMEKGKVADYGILNSWKFEQLMRFFFFFRASQNNQKTTTCKVNNLIVRIFLILLWIFLKAKTLVFIQ